MWVITGIAALLAVILFVTLMVVIERHQKREAESQSSFDKAVQHLKGQLEEARSKMAPQEQLKAWEAEIALMKTDALLKMKAVDDEIKAKKSELESSIQTKRKSLDDELKSKKAELESINKMLKRSQSELDLQDVGFTRQDFTYEDPASYQNAIQSLEDEQADMIRQGSATSCKIDWTIEGSRAKGEKMIAKLMKLALRTFNGDSDAAITKVKWNNFAAMSDRILKSEQTIEKTLDKWGITINDHYRDLKVKELRLTFEQAELQQRIREEQRELREQQREEEKARKEAEAAEREAEREERRLEAALEKAKKELSTTHSADLAKQQDRIKELEARILVAEEIRQRAISMAQLTKSGHVYITSNVGSFGDSVLKLGMTRRLDPMDRIWELSDASVPFDFDVHAMIKTNDAPALEAKLHAHFSDRRINLINLRKEFFRVTVEEVQHFITQYGLDVKLTLAAEAKELHETRAILAAKGK